MNAFQRQVSEFHKLCDILESDQPTPLDRMSAAYRVRLMQEELDEAADALRDADMNAIVKELCDLLYVTFGTLNVLGVHDVTQFFGAVHRSNLTKVGANGKVEKRADGKILKPHTYRPARIEVIGG